MGTNREHTYSCVNGVKVAPVSKVTIYQFTIYDIGNDENRKSRRWATREAVECIGGKVLEETATEIDATDIGAEIDGMTARNFDPHALRGFQRAVAG